MASVPFYKSIPTNWRFSNFVLFSVNVKYKTYKCEAYKDIFEELF